MKKQSGFTLVELVIVVVILGFLAVTAIPKFLDLSDQAKQANIEGMAGGFATGVSLARAQWEAEARPDIDGENIVNYDGNNVLLTAEGTNIQPGYVIGIEGDAGGAEGGELNGFSVTNCENVWRNILQQPPGVTSDISTLNSNDTMSYFVGQSQSGANALCHYYLKESLERDSNGDWSEPTSGDTTIGNSFTYQPANSSVIIYINTP